MEEKIFLWIEDRKGKAGYIFWAMLMNQLYPNVIVVSQKNSSELLKAVRTIDSQKNKYIVVMDNSFDNLQIIMEQKKLRQYARQRDNVALLDVICFEYILLGFSDLLEWVFAKNDELLDKRENAVLARNKLVECMQSGNMHYKDMAEIATYDPRIQDHNIEQLVARLLFDITRNTGFEVSKGKVGDCWVRSCCEWQERREDDICGLDDMRLSLYEKMKTIYEKSCLRNQFEALGLEMMK